MQDLQCVCVGCDDGKRTANADAFPNVDLSGSRQRICLSLR